ncbi:MAG TPA: NAD(P)/FAD-dependent oxidoreductase, partial [archaeon]|nr:NAD(P)/FAD-dependent oxidoreductase [archaeon]
IVNTIEEFSVNDLIQENNFVVGVKGKHKDGREQEFRGKVVVGADGAASVVARKLGVEQKDPDHIIMAVRAYYRGITGMTPNIELHFLESIIPGYFWIFPLEDGTANVGIGMVKSDMQKTKMNLTEAMFKAIEEDPLFKNRFKNAEIEGPVRGWTLPSGSRRTKNHGNGWLLIGDAASLIDPFSGEGIGNAMTSGKYASEVISEALRANDFSEKFFYKYEKMIQENLDPELKNSYSLQKWGKHKWLLNFLIGKASKNKQVQELLSGMLVNEEAKKKLYSPLFYLKLLFS